jgi:hypothetical protein
LSSLSIIYDDYLEATTTLTQGAFGIEFLELSQKPDRSARKRDAMWDSCLHLFTGYPQPTLLHIDSVPRECRHRSHSKARGDGEAGGERQMLGQLFA